MLCEVFFPPLILEAAIQGWRRQNDTLGDSHLKELFAQMKMMVLQERGKDVNGGETWLVKACQTEGSF